MQALLRESICGCYTRWSHCTLVIRCVVWACFQWARPESDATGHNMPWDCIACARCIVDLSSDEGMHCHMHCLHDAHARDAEEHEYELSSTNELTNLYYFQFYIRWRRICLLRDYVSLVITPTGLDHFFICSETPLPLSLLPQPGSRSSKSASICAPVSSTCHKLPK